jgi:hypothetical protein
MRQLIKRTLQIPQEPIKMDTSNPATAQSKTLHIERHFTRIKTLNRSPQK